MYIFVSLKFITNEKHIVPFFFVVGSAQNRTYPPG
jgi:hypothetical protein